MQKITILGLLLKKIVLLRDFSIEYQHQINIIFKQNSFKMKKLVFTLGMACLFMVACNNTPKQAEQPAEPVQEEKTEVVEEKQECPMGKLMNEFTKWDEFDDNVKADLNAKAIAMFAEMDAKMEEMKEKGEGCAKECEKKLEEMTAEQKAECEKKCAEMKAECEAMKAAWENIANLSVDEQKDLIIKRIEGMKQCHHGEKGCCKGEQAQCGEKPAE